MGPFTWRSIHGIRRDTAEKGTPMGSREGAAVPPSKRGSVVVPPGNFFHGIPPEPTLTNTIMSAEIIKFGEKYEE